MEAATEKGEQENQTYANEEKSVAWKQIKS